MDDIDREIVSILRRDGRRSYTDIADDLNVSEGTVRNRVKRMKEEGDIQKFTVITSGEGMGALVMTKVSTERDISEVVEELPEDTEIHEIAGDYDIVVKIFREDKNELNDEIDSIREIEGVKETRTYSVLKSHYL
ncbi:MAG: Lrp/AsnC family transcriptional regulator [Candidatus Aenigmatarchaeota archaeon]